MKIELSFALIVPRRLRFAVGAALVATTLVAAFGRTPSAPAAGGELTVEPARVILSGGRARQRLVATWFPANERRGVRPALDVSARCGYACSDPDVVEVDDTGHIRARGDGRAEIRVAFGGSETSVEVEVRRSREPHPISFRREVVATLARGGCSSGACHGSPSGKNGFRLSLRGGDPDADLMILSRELLGRRTNPNDPASSLLLRKALGKAKHPGGQVFAPGSLHHRLLREWIAEGVRDDADPPRLSRIELYPPRRTLDPACVEQRLLVTAVFADGSRLDVTDLAVLSIDDAKVAEVASGDVLQRRAKGEVTVLARYLDQLTTAGIAFLPETSSGELRFPPAINYVDRHVFDKLRELGIPATRRAGDREFIRRVYLDTIARLPEVEEVEAFVADGRPGKRERLIDRLLARPEFDDFWALKWLDLLGSSDKALGRAAVLKLQRWTRNALASRMPLDEMARRLVTAEGDVNLHPEANFYRVAGDPTRQAEIAGQLFLGIRIGCARCHNHPFESWTQDDYYAFASVFNGVRVKGKGPNPGTNNSSLRVDRQIVWNDPTAPRLENPRSGRPAVSRFLGDAVEPRSVPADRRELFARWLTRPDNPYFARSLANRIWYHLFGRGIVEPADDFRASNPPSNARLLEALASDLAGGGYDLRGLVRTILMSSTYQLSSTIVPGSEDYAKYFPHAQPRLLGAEQLVDAVNQVCGVSDRYPELPTGTRAVELPDVGASTDPLLRVFGKPQREISCECERMSRPSFSRTLEMVSGRAVNEKLGRPDNRLGRLLDAGRTDEEVLLELYLAALSRPPTQRERAAAAELIEAAPGRRAAFEDVLWALLNSKEFLFRR